MGRSPYQGVLAHNLTGKCRRARVAHLAEIKAKYPTIYEKLVQLAGGHAVVNGDIYPPVPPIIVLKDVKHIGQSSASRRNSRTAEELR